MSRKTRRLESPIEVDLFEALVNKGIEPDIQFDIGSFRVDFVYHDEKLIVEADGFSYHDRNKKQFEYERQRERFIIRQGYTVIRFAGTEIHRDADSCATEVKMQLRRIHEDLTEVETEFNTKEEFIGICCRCNKAIPNGKGNLRMFMYEESGFGEGKAIAICEECEGIPTIVLNEVLSRQFEMKGEVWR